MILGLSGKKRSGKSTLGRALTALWFWEVAFADALKELAADLLGLSVKDLEGYKTREVMLIMAGRGKTLNVRELLQRLGVGARCALGKDVWINAVRGRITDLYAEAHYSGQKDCNIVITDVRFPDEVAFIKKMEGKIIRLNRRESLETRHHFSVDCCGRPETAHPASSNGDDHESESSLPDDSNGIIVYDAVFTGSLEENTEAGIDFVRRLLAEPISGAV